LVAQMESLSTVRRIYASILYVPVIASLLAVMTFTSREGKGCEI
jgi:hypothetical protein